MNDKEVVQHNTAMQEFFGTSKNVDEYVNRRKIIDDFIKRRCREGVHYGKPFPSSDRKTLLKPMADELCAAFGVTVKFEFSVEHLPNNHREYDCKAQFYSSSGVLIGEGIGTCSTMESKFRWRNQKPVCPNCGLETIMVSKFNEYEMYCNKKAGGCGKKFAKTQITIPEGKQENPDIADQHNTAKKIAGKRAHSDGTIRIFGLSSQNYTQDIGDPEDDNYTPADKQPTAPREENREENKEKNLSEYNQAVDHFLFEQHFLEQINDQLRADGSSTYEPDEMPEAIGKTIKRILKKQSIKPKEAINYIIENGPNLALELVIERGDKVTTEDSL